MAYMTKSFNERVELFTKQKNFSPLQFERVCRRQNKCDLKNLFCFGKSRKHGGKRRKYWLPAVFPFLQCFQKASLSGSLKFVIVNKLQYLAFCSLTNISAMPCEKGI